MRKAIRVSTGIRAGGSSFQHNRKLAVRVKAGVKAGGVNFQHNRGLRSR